jgi:hypothetical protein
MEGLFWFALGSVAGASLTKWGRQGLMSVATATIVVADAVGAGANRVSEVISTRTAEQRKQVAEFLAEARSKARQPKSTASPMASRTAQA